MRVKERTRDGVGEMSSGSGGGVCGLWLDAVVGEQSASYHAAHHYQRDFLHKFIFMLFILQVFISRCKFTIFFVKKAKLLKKTVKLPQV